MNWARVGDSGWGNFAYKGFSAIIIAAGASSNSFPRPGQSLRIHRIFPCLVFHLVITIYFLPLALQMDHWTTENLLQIENNLSILSNTHVLYCDKQLPSGSFERIYPYLPPLGYAILLFLFFVLGFSGLQMLFCGRLGSRIWARASMKNEYNQLMGVAHGGCQSTLKVCVVLCIGYPPHLLLKLL